MNTQTIFSPLAALRQRVARAMSGEPLEAPLSDDDVELLRKRNADRVKAAIESLGPRWVGNTVDVDRKRRVHNAIADQRPEWVA